ncbi:ankyrin repeat domain-containing protein [Leptospira gomenensis]|uniref:Ankyrin repeat domain-containing protein n=1 Tax=Leptospira gomenensis TaxID=2484974 RepID=A0A5F1YKD7_9LEPT|nr:ankyrin repeat domain-containing protein [Leptospira gomenensis]TGK38421.1 ankyrin repeat domain-containing protein [Leptospira gomenensis]TGK41997.1 ankyrin repeat domain-containing protein [Leptospira gomenensis]TGK52235.1 ankyrin repeat domain-containing protein [Leptospira gomenensis]TGK55778.1 ankyrin repeat domain-containing protein [Leptospira gomenensis]
MKPTKTILSLIILSVSIFAETGEHPEHAIGESLLKIAKRANLPEASVSGSGIKAVLIVGDVDGDDGPGTLGYSKNMRAIAKILRERGVSVTEYYSPKNSWDQIRQSVQGANLLLYAGHGVGSNLTDSPYHQKYVGGFALKGKFVSNDDVETRFHPAPGAIVLFLGACFTAGNMAYDMGVIDAEETKHRISMYSAPFLKAGFQGYYATWAPWTAQTIVAELFTDKNFGTIYESQTKTNEVTRIDHPTYPNAKLYYHKGRQESKTVFDYAFAGNPNAKLNPASTPAKEEPNSPSNTNNTQTTLSQEEQTAKNEALVKATYKKDVKTAAKLLNEGANPNTETKGWRILHLAVYFDLPELVKLLLDKKADPNHPVDGYTALSLANAYERSSIVPLLEAAGGIRSRSASIKPKPEKP